MGLPQAIGGAIGIGSSLIGGLFNRGQRKQDAEARSLKLQGMKDASNTAGMLTNSYQDLTGQSNQAWNTASPIYQNLLSEYNKAVENPYYYVAPDIEQSARDTSKQTQSAYQSLGRGSGQKYAATLAKINLGSNAQSAVRNAKQWGMQGQSGIADVYNQRSTNTSQLAQNALSNAGSLYSSLSNNNWQNSQSSWPSAIASIGGLTSSWLLDKYGKKS